MPVEIQFIFYFIFLIIYWKTFRDIDREKIEFSDFTNNI